MATNAGGFDEAGATRRDFLRAGTAGAFGLGLATATGPALASPRSNRDGAVILLMLVGGPSQFETFDPKPDAPAEVRGPFRSIATALPGVRVVEHLPEVARRMGRLTLVRSLHHDSAPIHEAGLQLIGTGRLCVDGADHPHLGAVAAKELGASGGVPPFVILPARLGPTGVDISQGQAPGPLERSFGPFVLDDDPASPGYDPRKALDRSLRFLDEAGDLKSAGAADRSSRLAFDPSVESALSRSAYGHTTFGRSCLLARRMVEAGSRMVVVNMATTVFRRPSWDAHGASPFSTFDDYAGDLLPTFDRAYSALIDDLDARGLLDSTLVVSTGEFGRSPKLNENGGRDHWPGAWSALLAGGGLPGGRVIGATDRRGAEPVDRPVRPSELVATMARTLGLASTGGPAPIA